VIAKVIKEYSEVSQCVRLRLYFDDHYISSFDDTALGLELAKQAIERKRNGIEPEIVFEVELTLVENV